MTTWIGIWKPVLVNRSDRPILEEGEHNIYVRDNIGLYHGKSKIINRQNGRIYLTNKRVIYFDNEDITNSMCLELSEIIRSEVIDGFLRTSPKVKLYLKEDKIDQDKQGTTKKAVDWVCNICSFNNHVSLNFDMSSEMPKCDSCGVRATKTVISRLIEQHSNQEETSKSTRDDQCPRCTFINHPSLKFCELCGTELLSSIPQDIQMKINNIPKIKNALNIRLEYDTEDYTNGKPYVKLSFRKGGSLVFNDALNTLLDELKWNSLQNKGAINQNGTKVVNKLPKSVIRGGGIHSLEQKGEQERKHNEIILSSSLDDLQQLMYKYQDLIKLSNSFSKIVKTKQLNFNIIPPLNIKKTSALYHKELSRHISEYLTSFELTKAFSMITKQDLFANYNRYLVWTQGFGTDLISAEDFNKSTALFDQLNLPVRIKLYEKSGLSVITPRTSENYNKYIVDFLFEEEKNFRYNKLKNELLLQQDSDNFLKEQFDFFKGSTISQISDQLSWSYNITSEEIENCIGEGSIVIDNNISGCFYFRNQFLDLNEEENDSALLEQIRQEIIEEQNKITSTLQDRFNLENSKNLINLHPNYSFGLLEDPDTETSTSVSLSGDIKSSSMNDLEGLTF